MELDRWLAFDPQLRRAIETLQLDVSPAQRQSLLRYMALLEHWNRRFNLTAIREPQDMLIKHLFDSLAIVPHLRPSMQQQIIDVGTGAGLPGIVLAILFPHTHFALLDSNAKKTRFLRHVRQDLGLNNTEIINQRVEAYHPDAPFDIILTRAFSALANTLELTTHLCAEGGRFILMKGLYPQDELDALPDEYEVEDIERVLVPNLDAERHLVMIIKRG